jgi:hypothetical protein
MKYTVQGTHNKHFEIFGEDGTTMGKLDYTSWFSTKSAIILQSGKSYEIGSTGVFQTSIEITSGGEEIGALKFNWKGQIILTLEGHKHYIFKRVGFFNSHFGLFTEIDKEIVILRQHFKMAEMSFTYDIETDDNYPEGTDISLILLLVYCANYMHTMGFAATS